MKIKLVLSLFLNLFILSYTQSQTTSDYVTLTGKLINFTNEIQVEDMSEMKDLELPNSKRTFLTDSIGNFSIQFRLGHPNYFRIGRNILYLSPGDSLSLFINRTWPDSATFEGTHSSENYFLRSTPFPKAGSFLEAGDNIKGSIEQTINFILTAAEKRKKLLYSYKDINAKFKIFENARINADIINSLRNIDTYDTAFYKLKGDKLVSYKKAYEKSIAPYVKLYSRSIINPDFLKLAVYRDVLKVILNYSKNNNENNKKLKDWIIASELVQELKELSTKEEIVSLERKIKTIQSDKYRLVVASTYKALIHFGNGDYAKDFDFKNNANQIFSLINYSGKVIYIDLWATWCGPCIEELPYMDSLKEKYKNNENIIFITLSIDSNEFIWRANLKKRNAHGIQGIIDRIKLEDYKISTIPKIIVINKSFKVNTMNGPLPSDPKTIKLLDDLLK